MAQKIEVRLVDDIDGNTADETVHFGIDGTEYEIDLSHGNAKKLRDCVAQYIEAARRLKRPVGGHQRQPRSAPRTSSTRERNQAIRDWAKSHGIEVSDRGRIAQDVVDRYDARSTG